MSDQKVMDPGGNTTHRDEDKWKHEPPYKIHDNGEDFKAVWHGQCHCGKVQYELSREKPLAAKYCHCGTCQRLHGAPFQWAAIFHKTDINFTSGHHDLGWYDSSAKSLTHHLPCKVSCAYCRTPLMDEGRNMILLFPSLIDDISSPRGREAFKPQSHMFYGSRVVDFHGDGIDKWEGLDKNSNKLDDEGEEVVERWKDGKKVDEDGNAEEKEDEDMDGDEEGEDNDEKNQNDDKKKKRKGGAENGETGGDKGKKSKQTKK